MDNEAKWNEHYQELKEHVKRTGHFPDKHTRLNNWVKYQRKRIKEGRMTEEQKQLFEQLANTRSHEHTGGRIKKSNSGKTEERGLFD